MINQLSDSYEFKWRDREGGFHDIKSMNTQHLFFTLRMIWNNAAPVDIRIPPLRIYKFPPEYTREYIIDSVQQISLELAERHDLTPYFNKCIEYMRINFALFKENGR